MQNDNILLHIDKVSASHQHMQVLDVISLQVSGQDIVCLLGPSGCGKTTLLRAVSGLHNIDQGRIKIDGKTICTPTSSIAPEKRNVGMMFQDLAHCFRT